MRQIRVHAWSKWKNILPPAGYMEDTVEPVLWPASLVALRLPVVVLQTRPTQVGRSYLDVGCY